jgi:hypothetical protein
MRRRHFLQTAFSSVPLISMPALSSGIASGLVSSETELAVLKSPISTQSSQQSEASVWYAEFDKDIYVCVATESPQVQSILQNQNKTNLAFRRVSQTSAQPLFTSSSIEVHGRVEHDRNKIDSIIAALEHKYHFYWNKFGDAITTDLRNGKKIIVRYQLAAT